MEDGEGAGDADGRPVAAKTIYEMNQPGRLDLRRLPGLVWVTLGLIWRAARLEAVVALGLQALSGPIREGRSEPSCPGWWYSG